MLLYAQLSPKNDLIHKFSFSIAASAADIPADNPNDNKTISANGVSTLFINGKLAVINDLRKSRNPPSNFYLLFHYLPELFLNL